MQDGRARTDASTFRRGTSVAIDIDAPPERVWSLLTDAAAMERWNSTVSTVEGPIALGSKLKLTVPVSDRTFSPKVTAFEANRTMTWSEGAAPMFKGVRVFTLEPQGDGRTRFSMAEAMSGLMTPMVARSFPDFAPIFERYAADLKAAAEAET